MVELIMDVLPADRPSGRGHSHGAGQGPLPAAGLRPHEYVFDCLRRNTTKSATSGPIWRPSILTHHHQLLQAVQHDFLSQGNEQEAIS